MKECFPKHTGRTKTQNKKRIVNMESIVATKKSPDGQAIARAIARAIAGLSIAIARAIAGIGSPRSS